MKTQGGYGIRTADVWAKYGERIRLYFIGDVHWNSPAHAKQLWEYDTHRIKQEMKKGQVKFILDGDIFEAFSSSERKRWSASDPHESNVKRFDRMYLQEVQDFVNENPFLVGNTLSVYGGNHFFQFANGVTSDQELARIVKAPFIGVCGYTLLTIHIDKHHSHLVKIFVHHGKSSGKKKGAMFNALEDAASYFVDADIIIMGHDHKMGAIPLPALRCDMGKGGCYKTKVFRRLVGRSGSYLRSYTEDEENYAHDAMFSPSTVGCLPVDLTPTRYNYNGKGIDDRWVEIESVVRA